MLDDTQLEALLTRRTRFRRLVHMASCSSTQDLAAAATANEDAVFWADHQTRGRGRQSREWHDEPGADLALTFRVHLSLPQPLALPAALPVAVLQACEPLAGRPLRVKWPNDLFLDNRKLCGVLIDAGTAGADSYLIGVGVNCNRVRFPPDLEAIATSLAAASGHLVDRGALLLAIAERLHAMLDDLALLRHEPLEAVFRDRLGLFGRRVNVDAGGPQRGTLTGLDFQQLQLDGTRSWPLAIVRSIRAD